MSKFLLVLLVLVPFIKVKAQTTQRKDITGSYRFTRNFIDTRSPQALKTDSTKKVEIYKGASVTVVDYSERDQRVYYEYWNYKNKEDSTKYNNDVFSMSVSEFERITIPLYNRFKGVEVGVYTVPFRLRGIGENFDFESSLSLQANMVFGFGPKSTPHSRFDASIGIGLTSANLTPINSNVTADRTASAFTLSLGGVIKPTDYANIGLFVGWDNLGASDKNVNWIYNGKTWLGLGINISFNNITTTKSAKDPKP